jgi:hypothetical protein
MEGSYPSSPRTRGIGGRIDQRCFDYWLEGPIVRSTLRLSWKGRQAEERLALIIQGYNASHDHRFGFPETLPHRS